jgi:hypothetical protein
MKITLSAIFTEAQNLGLYEGVNPTTGVRIPKGNKYGGERLGHSLEEIRKAPDYIAFRTAYVVSGFLGSFLIYAVCYSIWKRSFRLIASVVWCVPACLSVGFLCSAAAVWSEAQFGGVERPFSWSVALAGTTGRGTQSRHQTRIS